MKAKVSESKDCHERRLPMFHRTVRFPANLWQAIKSQSKRENKSLRWVIDEALDAELLSLVTHLRELGFKGEVKPNKLVRVPLDDNVVGRLNFARRQTGLPAVLLLRICLRRHVPEIDSTQ